MELKIGQYDKKVKGKKAVLNTEIFFYTSITRDKNDRKIFPAGTIVVAEHEVYGTGLTTFNFDHNGQILQHVVREGKFSYLK